MIEDGNAARKTTMFGDYDIIETVGQGGMGIVYRAIDTSLGRTVALKVLKDDLRSHKGVVARFQREAEAYASLNHPNIVQIYTVGSVGNIPYIAMELIDGEPLSVIMRRERRISWKRALEIGEQVAQALGSAHEAQIIHRDIKPGNILVASDHRVYVTDFGIAKVLTAETQLTVDGSRLGTPQYMSPERCQNSEITFSSDLYSLGIVLFQMISGRLPYESNDTIDLIRKIVSDPPKRLSAFMPNVPSDVERLIAFLIEKKTENRPGSAEEWIYLCQRVRNGKPMVEDDSGLESSLKSFRDSMPTPTSTKSNKSRSTQKNKFINGRVKKLWGTLSLNAKTGVVTAATVLALALAGWLYAARVEPTTSNDLARSLGALSSDWKLSNRVATFYREMPGITLIQLENLDWIPSPVGWMDDNWGLVHIKGRAGSEWEGQEGLLTVQHGQKVARIVLAPMDTTSIRVVGVDSEHGTALLALDDIQGSTSHLYRIDLNSNNQTVVGRSSFYSIVGSASIDTFNQIDGLKYPPSSEQSFLIGESRAVLGDWGIYSIQKGKAVGPSIVPPGAVIGSVDLTADGARLAFTRNQIEGKWSLYWTDSEASGQVENHLSSNLASAVSFDLHPSGTKMLLAEVNSNSDYEVSLYEVRTSRKSLLFRDAKNVRWHPNGVDAIVVAPDRKGVNQLWRVSTLAPNPRKQITFLEDGVADVGEVSPDGNTFLVATNSETKPSLIVVDLERLTKAQD